MRARLNTTQTASISISILEFRIESARALGVRDAVRLGGAFGSCVQSVRACVVMVVVGRPREVPLRLRQGNIIYMQYQLHGYK